ncbi:MAG: DUF92 domain-containing protein [bacterium]
MIIVQNLCIAALLSLTLTGIAWRLKWLTLSGATAASLLGTVVLGLGGWSWVFPLLAFFVTSTLLSIYRVRRVGVFEETKGARRDAMQVLANGGVAGAIVILGLWNEMGVLPAYLGALAAATADTWSSEIGIALGKNPRRITDGKPVLPGVSGGVTLAGLVGGLSGAILIALTGWLSVSLRIAFRDVLIIILAGLAGTVFDSLLGATVQSQRSCSICGKTTEREQHCGRRTEIISGWKRMNNDAVNLCATAAGALIGALPLLLLN